jgi:hypothetical protein
MHYFLNAQYQTGSVDDGLEARGLKPCRLATAPGSCRDPKTDRHPGVSAVTSYVQYVCNRLVLWSPRRPERARVATPQHGTLPQ